MKGLIMFKLHMGHVREGVFGHSHPFAMPSSPKKTPKSYFLLIFKYYFAHLCIAMNVSTSHGGAKMCKIMLKNE